MSLRWRFTLIATGLLAAVLAGTGVALMNLDEARARADIRDRMRRAAERHVPRHERRRPVPRHPDASAESIADEADGAQLLIQYGPPDAPAPLYVRYTGEAMPPDAETWRLEAGEEDETELRTVERADGEHLLAAFTFDRPGPPDPGGGRRGFGRRPGGPRVPLRAVVELEREVAMRPYAGGRRTMLFAGVGALLLGGLLAFLLAGAMLRPIGRAATAAEKITRVEQRLPGSSGSDELARLVTVLNGMLARLEAGTERERRFLATASHEIRRPLAALTGELELALRGGADAEALRTSLGLALSDARGLGRLTDDLLDAARIRAGAFLLDESEVDLVELVTETVSAAERFLTEPATLTIGDLPDVRLRGDRVALGRILENLVVNAGTHGGAGVHVEIGGDLSRGGLELFVDDDGPGVGQDDLEHIFEPFGRGDTTHARSGMGLGLSIVRDLIRAHGGEVEAASPAPHTANGRGTRFVLKVPRERIVS